MPSECEADEVVSALSLPRLRCAHRAEGYKPKYVNMYHLFFLYNALTLLFIFIPQCGIVTVYDNCSKVFSPSAAENKMLKISAQ